jgi:hypothetical protein
MPFELSPEFKLPYNDTVWGRQEERIAGFPKSTLGGTVLAK